MKNLKKEIIQIMKNAKKRDELNIDLFNRMREALKPFEGKNITKRILAPIEKAIPEYKITYTTAFGMRHIKVHTEKKRDLSFLLGYDPNPIYSDQNFVKFTTCYGQAAQERISEIDKMLSDKEFIKGYIKTIKQYVSASNLLEEKYNTWKNPIAYEIKNKFDIK